MSHIEINDANFEAQVINDKGLVLVDFWAPWCMPCQMLGPIIEELAGEVGDKVKVGKLNVDENPSTSSKYNVMSIPMVVLFNNGEIVEQFVGIRTKDEYLQAIKKQLEK